MADSVLISKRPFRTKGISLDAISAQMKPGVRVTRTPGKGAWQLLTCFRSSNLFSHAPPFVAVTATKGQIFCGQ